VRRKSFRRGRRWGGEVFWARMGFVVRVSSNFKHSSCSSEMRGGRRLASAGGPRGTKTGRGRSERVKIRQRRSKTLARVKGKENNKTKKKNHPEARDTGITGALHGKKKVPYGNENETWPHFE